MMRLRRIEFPAMMGSWITEECMVGNLRLNKIFWSITALLAFASALAGILFRDIYAGLFPADFLPGAFPQDVLTVLVCITLFVLIVITKKKDVKKQVIIIGLTGSLFYLYGIFTIERVYNWYYLLYAGVFASSFWSIIYSLSGFRTEAFSGMRLNGGMLKITAISSLFIAVLFISLWIMSLIPLMRDRHRIDYLYSIYILDLCFVMPAFIITAVMALRGKPLGILLAPAVMITGFFVIFPLGLNELAKPFAGMPIGYGPMAVSFAFAAFMLALAILQLRMIRLKQALPAAPPSVLP
jgi:hypothetical protein